MICVENAHVLFPLLAATRAASTPQLPSFFLEFLIFLSYFTTTEKFCNGKNKGLAILLIFLTFLKTTENIRRNGLCRKCTCFISTIGDDGSRQVPSDADVLSRVL